MGKRRRVLLTGSFGGDECHLVGMFSSAHLSRLKYPVLGFIFCLTVLLWLSQDAIPLVDTAAGPEKLKLRPDIAAHPASPSLQPEQPLSFAKPLPLGVPSILILTPMKSAAQFLDGLFRNIRNLTYSHDAISLAFLHSGGTPGPFPESATWNK